MKLENLDRVVEIKKKISLADERMRDWKMLENKECKVEIMVTIQTPVGTWNLSPKYLITREQAIEKSLAGFSEELFALYEELKDL